VTLQFFVPSGGGPATPPPERRFVVPDLDDDSDGFLRLANPRPQVLIVD
jgi:hypothetical protein